MNHTKSGIIAHGSPNSIARHIAELRNALDNDLCLLLLTDEGRGIAKRFSLCEGCAWSEMTEEGRAGMLKKDHAWKFFTGVAWALETFFSAQPTGCEANEHSVGRMVKPLKHPRKEYENL